MKPTLSHLRREFLGCIGGAVGTLYAQSWASLARGDSPNDRIRVGVIGTGVRGKHLISNLPPSVRVAALCDCAKSRLADTLNPQAQFTPRLAEFRQSEATRCTTHRDYRRMIDSERLDAVIIATPDHHHAQAALLALEAGLDVYLEKPLTTTIHEGRVLARAVATTGRVLQVGSQQRTMEMNQFACEFIRDGGLGKISRVEVPNYPGPIRDSDLPGEPIPDGLDWDLFLGPAMTRPYNQKLWIKDEFEIDGLLWRGWDLFRDYSGHLMTNWGAHSIDMVQYALGTDESGPVDIIPSENLPEELENDWQEKWREKTPHPPGPWSTASRFRPVTMTYPNGVTLQLVPGVRAATFYGEKGRMVIARNRYEVDPPDLITEGPDPSVLEKWDGPGHVARPHLQNWIDCIRSRQAPNAPVEVGHRSAAVCHLANIARELNVPLRWDPHRELFPANSMANQLLSRPRRAGFELPAF